MALNHGTKPGPYEIGSALVFVGDEVHPGEPSKLFAIPEAVGSIETRDGTRFLVDHKNEAAPGPPLRRVLGWTGLPGR